MTKSKTYSNLVHLLLHMMHWQHPIMVIQNHLMFHNDILMMPGLDEDFAYSNNV